MVMHRYKDVQFCNGGSRHIVAKVDELMALCDTLEKKIDERTSKESALLEAVAARV